MNKFTLSMIIATAAILSVVDAAAVPDLPAAVGAPVVKMIRSSPNAANDARKGLEKRSSSTVTMTCYTQTDCTGQATPHDLSFTSNSPCINAANCQCMFVTTLDNAHIVYWNHQTCNGNKSVLNGCFDNGNVQQASPGTNSLGFHVGCSGS